MFHHWVIHVHVQVHVYVGGGKDVTFKVKYNQQYRTSTITLWCIHHGLTYALPCMQSVPLDGVIIIGLFNYYHFLTHYPLQIKK